MEGALYATKDPYGLVCEMQAKNNQEYDYEILRITTHAKHKGNIRSFAYSELSHFNNGVEFLLYEEIYQTFEIRLKQKEIKYFSWCPITEEKALDLEAVLSLEEGLVYDEKIKDKLIQELYKEMVKEGLLVGIRILPIFLKQLDEIIEQIKTQEYPSSITFKVAKGIVGRESQMDKMVLKHPIFQTSQQEMYYEKPVQKDSLLFYYKRGIKGVKGRNLKGEILETSAKNIHKNMPKILEGIYTKQTDEGYLAYAKQYGYLFKSGNEFGVFNEIRLQEISLKTTGNLQANLKEDISLHIRNFDKLQDSIGENIELCANSIQVDGNVGKSSISAHTIEVQGQTHLKTNIQAHNATLSNLKGSIKGEVVCVDSLENGKIKAKVAIVNQCMGGKIIADKIYIKNLKSYNEIYPKEELVIGEISGDMNLLEISTEDKEGMCENEVILSQDINELRTKLQHLLLNMEHSYSYINKNQSNVFVLKNSLNGQKMPANIMNIIHKYEEILQKYKENLKEYQDLIRLIFHLEGKRQKIEDAIMDIKCVIMGMANGKDNLLRYKIKNANQKELRYMLDGTKYKYFSLNKLEDNGLFRLQKEEEYKENKIAWINYYQTF
ncbi:hypothetical protein B6S12_03255 [Helicobacter valdiviensis]|uniref:DUF342 domain-containing protein n=1 Tax=Helicobacter valdiviensis TaxID=1458358 RepID=A0A2W6MVH3_9HELI|nr:flagellar assembly protein A [Helicobacter valdiviensis]PZT48505.1 hypothetical protein B6S12_03255 [Helicobacter valdiviensis]